jgi:hypothetical protein
MKTTNQNREKDNLLYLLYSKISSPTGSIYALAIIFFTLGLNSCKKYIDIPPPISQVVTTSVFNNNQNVIAAQLGVYTTMPNFCAYLKRTTGISSDELFTYSTDLASKRAYSNALLAADATSSTLTSLWSPVYTNIYSENAILEGLADNKSITSAVSKQTLGEAYFTRSYLYFNLINLYGDVPLVTTTDYTVNESLPRTSVGLVYQQIISDLISAKGLLSTKYLDQTDTVITSDRVRPTSWAASALLSRVYLYTGVNYDKAEAEATVVINNTSLFSLPTDLNTVFKKTSVEAIWQIMPTNTAVSVSEGQMFVITGTPSPSNTFGTSTISNSLLNAFEPNDKRQANWISTFSNATGSYIFASKYKRGSNATGLTDEYSMVLRLAEQYLIRAEARAQQNNLGGAISDINVIRTRAGLPSLANTLTKDQVLEAVAQERRVELFTEGDRWFNLKRTQTIDAVMGAPGNATTTKGGTWNTNQKVYPLPPIDIQRDPNLLQNTGY